MALAILGALARVLARVLGAPLASVSPRPPAASAGSAGSPAAVQPADAIVADAIVILGAPLGRDGELTPIAEERVRAGVALYEQGLAPVVCVVGGHCPRGHRHGPAEAEGMARWVGALGVPEEAIRVDRRSTSTFTNALRAAEILLPEGRKRVWLVTQPFHLRRARYYFRRAGFEPLGWHIDGSLQYREPRRALRWIAREYGAWALALWNTTRAARSRKQPARAARAT